MPPPKPKLAQEDWDEAVRTNIDDFDMAPEEAVQAATEEFEARYDLSAVLRAADGAAAAAAHPVAVAAAALRAALGVGGGSSGSGGSSSAETDTCAAVAALAGACFPSGEEARQPALAVATKEDVAGLLLQAAAAAGGGGAASPSPSPSSSPSLPSLRLLRRLLLRSADARAGFLTAGGVERCAAMLAQSLVASPPSSSSSPAAADGANAATAAAPASSPDWPRVAAVVGCCEAACVKCEEAKCLFAAHVPVGGLPAPLAAVAATAAAPCPDEEQAGAVATGGFVSLLLGGVLSSAGAPPAAVGAAAGVLKALTYGDDDSALASRAFTHARLLAKTHGALRDLLFALQRLSQEEEEAAAASAAAGAEGEAKAGAAAAANRDNDSDNDDEGALPSTRAEAVAAVLAAVRSVAANDDACRGFSDDGGVRACLQLLRRAVAASAAAGGQEAAAAAATAAATATTPPAAGSPSALARASAGALRQLANSDPVKTLLAGDGALDVIVDAIARFSGGKAGGGGASNNGSNGGGGGKVAAATASAKANDVAPSADGANDRAHHDDDDDGDDQPAPPASPDVLEPVAALLAAMTLRQPEIALAAAHAGAVAALCAALGRLAPLPCSDGALSAPPRSGAAASSSPPSSTPAGPACRQLCLAVRNMACRGGDGLRAAFLASGAEPLLRAAKAAHPAACRDVGSAALRDLGLDNYNA